MIGRKKPRKIHPGEALSIIPTPTPHRNHRTRRYKKGDLDTQSIIAFVTHMRESGDMPKEILRVRGRLRNAFPGLGVNKLQIRAAYQNAGWDIGEISWEPKKERKAAQIAKSSKPIESLKGL